MKLGEMTNIPKNWIRVPLGAVTEGKVKQQGPTGDNDFTYIDISSVNNQKKRITEPKVLANSMAPSRAKQNLKAGDVLVSMTRPNLNAIAQVPLELDGAVGSTGFHVLRPKAVMPGWLYYAVQANDFVSAMSRLVQGALYPAVRPKDIIAYEILIPPTTEQNRIIAKIEELLSDLDAGVAALERVRAKLKRYRVSILNAAVTGKLTEAWRKANPPTETAEVLLARILKERRNKWNTAQLKKFAQADKSPPKDWQKKYQEPTTVEHTSLPSLPNGWLWTTLDAISFIAGGITKGQRHPTGTELSEVPYLRVANVQRGFLDLSAIKTIAATKTDIQELALKKGDVLFNEGGDRDKLGRGWVWNNEIPECIHQNHVFRARMILPETASKFVSFHGNSFGQQWFLRTGKQSVNLASINMGVLKKFPVPLPPLDEQAAIVSEVERRLSVSDAIQIEIENTLRRAARLRQAILKKAFEGKLIMREASDDTASDRLKRNEQLALSISPQRQFGKIRALVGDSK